MRLFPICTLFLLLSIHLPLHLLLDVVQNQLGLFLHHVTVVFVVHVQLEGVEESELVVSEGIVEFVAIVNPALTDDWNFLLE